MSERDVGAYIEALKKSDRLGRAVVHHQAIPGREAVHADTSRPWPGPIRDILAARGVTRLFSHQAKACDLIRAGRHTVVATPTASGKSLTYLLPVLEEVMRNPESRALALFPLKALAQDQLRAIEELLSALPPSARPRAAILDGDTSQHFRRKLRDDPPNLILSNPEMLHLSMLPHHASWTTFLAGLTHVIVDEAHTYRGVMGSHMAHVFRRLRRVCQRYGARPTFVFCSATIGNPAELASGLTGLEVELVAESGAPAGARDFLFLNPLLESPSTTAVALLQAALPRELRTIVYTQSRKMTELIAMWIAERAGPYANRVSAYRAGFLPEERREIEADMTSGRLLGVVSTSALELGIDIGGLDLCVLCGYPGSIMSTWQRGGRVGRSGRKSAVVLVAGEDALDQYFMRNPRDFFDRPPESAVINPDNPVIAARHVECAASELPLRAGEPFLTLPGVGQAIKSLSRQGLLLEEAEGGVWHAARKRPHREVNLRGTGGQYAILSDQATIGLIDEHRAFKETHPGAVYIHRGRSFVVEELDLAGRSATVREAKVDYYTRARGQKTTEILDVLAVGAAHGAAVGLGRLRVTETVTGYERRRVRGGQLLSIVPLDLPPLTFETEGVWYVVPRDVQEEIDRRLLHFMGAIHAAEHALIGILPLLVLTDRGDLGGISTPLHPQLGRAAVFVYDGAPGGVGLSRLAFARAAEALEKTLAAVAGCPCETGCPSCVHSPKCGSGNRPIDKQAAIVCLELLIGALPASPEMARPEELASGGGEDEAGTGLMAPLGLGPRPARRDTAGQATGQAAGRATDPATGHARAGPGGRGPEDSDAPGEDALLDAPPPGQALRYGVLDVETRRSAEEVGGWGNARKMGVSVAVLYDSGLDDCLVFGQEDMAGLVAALARVDLVVGFNSRRFDYSVLSGLSDYDFHTLPTLDILEKVHARLGYRLSLDGLAGATLGAKKGASGLDALRWWKEGALDKITAYCRQDVLLTRDLYLFGAEHGYLLFTNKAGKMVRVPVAW